jgi:formylglycine-generating enzyme required for sulfatase activity
LRTGAADLDRDGKIVLDELYEYVYERILTSGYAKQTPHKWAQKVQGQIVIARSPHPTSTLIDLPPDLQQAIHSPTAWMREGAVGGLRRLMVSREGQVAHAAQAALERLARDENPSVSSAAARVLGIESQREDAVSTPSAPPVAEPAAILDSLVIETPIKLELVRIPAGPFLMGSDPAKDKHAREREQPQHTLELPEFYMGKYPVTNAQYAVFVQATGRSKPRHWEDGEVPSGKEDHPVVHVSWQDAVAFCTWLSRETGREFTLSSEAEWEKAARGTDGQIYPWGDDPPTPELCNFGQNVGNTTSVGNYSPVGDSPYGCVDMAGNVWEWCRTKWESDYKDYQGDDDLEGYARRVLRGGSFSCADSDVRCAYRYRIYPNLRRWYSGFRVVASPVRSDL